jgi:hypothetical protein
MYPPFTALPLTLEAAISDSPIRLGCVESLPLFHILVTSAHIKARELDTANPFAEVFLSGRPRPTRTKLGRWLPKRQYHTLGGANSPGIQYLCRREHSCRRCRTHRRYPPSYKRIHGIPRASLWFLRMGKVWKTDVPGSDVSMAQEL